MRTEREGGTAVHRDDRETVAAGPATAAPVRVIPAAALALLGDLYGPTVICAVCTRTIKKHGKPCRACGSRDTMTAVPAAGAEPPPGYPCRHCRTLTTKRTRQLCPTCYTRVARVENYLFLTAWGIHPDLAALRLGVCRRTIERAIDDLADIRNGARRQSPPRSSPAAAGEPR
jgi:RNA polymerase subunit RPABC4/transcription elongation factor Spt4